MPFSLDIEPLDEALRNRAIGLAQEVGLASCDWERKLAELDGSDRLRVRLGRALALGPGIVVLEHPSVALARADVAKTAAGVRQVIARRRLPDQPPLASVTLTMDLDFAEVVATRVLTLDPASGHLAERRRRSWFGRGTPSL